MSNFFQEYIDKMYDFRVTIMGKNIFALAIYSQESDLSKVDFWARSPSMINQELIGISNELKRQIIQFVKSQGLIYSSMDFAVTREGQYFFLENNANGQWQWVDDITSGALSEEMINLLIGDRIVCERGSSLTEQPIVGNGKLRLAFLGKYQKAASLQEH